MNPEAQKSKINEYNEVTAGYTPEQILTFALKEFSQKLVFASSMGEEDQVLTDMISKTVDSVEIFTLDTGRLYKETYDLIEKTQKRYKLKFKIYSPDTLRVEEMVNNRGINLFYESIENRKLCCAIRKVEPLQRALASSDAWICGLRRAQSPNRSQVKIFEWDNVNYKVKINPLAYWTHDDVKDYIINNTVDVNPLHAKGFVSIGCAPCTRAIEKGEDARAGRWWWETPDQKECGLHKK